MTLTCPFCPASAYPTKKQDVSGYTVYKCPAHHTFFIKKKEEKSEK